MTKPVSFSESPRKLPLEVLSFGLPRTGSTSLKAALEILGYSKVHHMSAMRAQSDSHQLLWKRAVDHKFHGQGKPLSRNEWEELLGEYAATTELPCCAFVEEMLDLYPEAKVILVERDVDRWFESLSNSIVIPLFAWKVNAIATLTTIVGSNPFLTTVRTLIAGYFGRGDYSAAGIMANAKDACKEHNAKVRALVPKESGRFFLLNLKDGWSPLCEFLGKEVPDVPFPRLNDSADMQKKLPSLIRDRLKVVLVDALKLTAPLLVFGACASAAWRLRGFVQ